MSTPSPPMESGSGAVLGQLLDHVPIGVVALDAGLRVTAWNAHAGRLLARSEAESLGEPFCDLLPTLDPGLLLRLAASPQARAVVESGGQELEVSAVPLLPSGGIAEMLVLLQDVSARTHAERQREEIVRRLGFISEASRLLALGLDVTSALERLARHCVPMMGELCVVELLTNGVAKVAAVGTSAPSLEPVVALLRKSPHRGNPLVPVFSAQLPGRALLHGDRSPEELRAAHGDAAGDLLAAGGFRSALRVPLIARGTALGAITFLRRQPYDYDDLPLAEEVARRAAAAADNARLFAGEQAAREAAEESARRTMRLQAVTAGLAGAIREEQVADVVLHEGLVAMGAAGGAVGLLDERAQELNILAHVGYRDRELARVVRYPLSAELPMTRACAAREMVLLEDRAAWARRFSVSHIASTANGAWAAVPLLLDDRCLGALGVSYLNPRRFTEGERHFLLALASQCAQALQRAELFRKEREARAAAEEAVRAREEFLSIASHELRTPLTPLMLHLDALKRVVAATPLEARVDTARRQTERLARLVENLLDVARINAGQLQLDLEELDLLALVRGVLERYHPQLERTGCTVTVVAEPVVGRWDRLRLEQVVSNLLGNALKYGAGKPILVQVSRSGAFARFSITDSGIGIAPEALERIFARFERAVSSREYGGLGLGLYIARQIVHSHGGTVTAESIEGQGAKFIVDLPLRAGPALPSVS